MQLFLQIPRVARAFEFAVQAHVGQKYADLPYFTHPLAVAEELVKRFPDADQDTIIIALMQRLEVRTHDQTEGGEPLWDADWDATTRDDVLEFHGVA